MTDQQQNLPDDTPAPEGSRFARAHHILLSFLGLVIIVWLLSGIYQVNTDQVAIIERLGTYVSNQEGKAILADHGLHYALPWPIDKVHKISIKQRRSMKVTTFNQSPDSYADFKADWLRRGIPQEILSSLFDPYLITGDKNVVHMEIAVNYLIDDPEAWLNTISHSADNPDQVSGMREALFQEIIQHAMTYQVARGKVDEILFTKQGELTTSLYETIQDHITLPMGEGTSSLGMRIQSVELVKARPPDRVKDAFDAVGAARQEGQTAISKASADANSAKLRAEAEKDTLITDARAYEDRVVNAARGEADRFKQVLDQYEKSPDVTRWNLYVEAVKSITNNANRIFFAQPGQHTIITIDPPQFDPTRQPPR